MQNWKYSSETTANPAARHSLVCIIFQRVCAIAGATPLTRGVCGWTVLVCRSREAGSKQAGRLRYAWHGAPSQGERLSNGRVTWSKAEREWEQPRRLNHSCGMERGGHANVFARTIRRGMRGWGDSGWDEQRNEQWVWQAIWEAAREWKWTPPCCLSCTCHSWGRRDHRGMTRLGLGFQIHESVSDRINTPRPKMTYIFPSV